MSCCYKIIHAEGAMQLESMMHTHIAEGWIPLGGAAVDRIGHNCQFFFQAVAKPAALVNVAMLKGMAGTLSDLRQQWRAEDAPHVHVRSQRRKRRASRK